MPVISECQSTYDDDYFKSFEATYPTIEHRLAAARQVAEATTRESYVLMPELDYISRNHLLAHWGDEPEELRAAADFVYTLADAVDQSFYEPALVFHRGDPQDLPSQSDSAARLTVDYGIINVRDIRHNFAANLTNAKRRRQGITSPYLGFGVQIQAKKTRRITADLGLETCEIEQIDPEKALLACVGTVSLRSELEYYHATKQKQERRVVVGSSLCGKLLKQLIKKVPEACESTLGNLENLAVSQVH